MPASKRRILCAEANRDICDLIVVVLERQGHEVRAVQTVAECLELAGAGRFDLYILNDKYTDGDSIELCKQLRRLDPDTPVLLFSVEDTGRERSRALAAGAQSFMPKTTDLGKLVQAVENILKQ